jgi:hypothetical protein
MFDLYLEIPKGQSLSKMDNPEKLATRRRKKKNRKHNTIFVGHHYTETNTNNVIKQDMIELQIILYIVPSSNNFRDKNTMVVRFKIFSCCVYFRYNFDISSKKVNYTIINT